MTKTFKPSRIAPQEHPSRKAPCGRSIWEVRVTCPTTGKLLKKSHENGQHFTSKRAAEAFRERWNVQFTEGTLVATDVTLGQAVEAFLTNLDTRWKAGEISQRTLRSKTHNTNRFWLVLSRELQLTQLSTDTVNQLTTALRTAVSEKTGRAFDPNTISSTKSVLGEVCNFAIDKGWLKLSPVTAARRVKGAVKRNKPVSLAVKKLLTEAGRLESLLAAVPEFNQTGVPARLIVRFALATGLRAGEQAALTWKNLDLDKGVIHVTVARNDDDSDDVKTETSLREVPILDEELLQQLRVWKLQQPLKQRSQNLVFPTSTGSQSVDGQWLKQILLPACTRAWQAERITWHGLRHAFASKLLSNGIDVLTVSQWLGHADTKTTLTIYTHWVSNEDQKNKARAIFASF